jgi:hypothetical protein
MSHWITILYLYCLLMASLPMGWLSRGHADMMPLE